MSEFNLDAWEIGPRCRESAEGAIGGEVSGKLYRAVEMRRKKWVVFVRESKGSQSGNWIVASMEIDAPHTWPKAPALTHSVSIATGLGRFFVWGEEMAFVFANGSGFWLDEQLEAEVPFWNAAPPDMIERCSRESFAHLSRELDGENDFAYARRWREWDEEAKLAALYGGAEQLEELRGLMRAVLVLESWAEGKERERVWQLGVYSEPRTHSRRRWNRVWAEADSSDGWTELIQEHLVVFSAAPIRHHACIAAFATTVESGVEVEVSSLPARHEYLEAHLHLREWLQLNAPERMDLLEVGKT